MEMIQQSSQRKKKSQLNLSLIKQNQKQKENKPAKKTGKSNVTVLDE